jgi:phosphate transport system substrate-binding protein
MSKEKPFYKYPVLYLIILAIPSFLVALNSICRNCIFQPPSPQETPTNKTNNIPKEKVIYGGSTSFAPIGEGKEMDKWIISKGMFLVYEKPGDNAHYGSKTGVKMLRQGNIDIALSSESLKYLDVDKLGKYQDKLEEHQVASDSIVFYVNKGLKAANDPRKSFSGLTISKLKGILTGTIKNWADVGGSGKMINVYSRDINASGTVSFIERNLLSPAKIVQERVPDVTTTSIQAVEKDIDGIGFASAAEVCNQRNSIQALSLSVTDEITYINPCDTNKQTNYVNLSTLENGTYPEKLKRPLFVIYKLDGKLSEQAGNAYFNLLHSVEGQGIIRRAGLIPLP